MRAKADEPKIFPSKKADCISYIKEASIIADPNNKRHLAVMRCKWLAEKLMENDLRTIAIMGNFPAVSSAASPDGKMNQKRGDLA